MTKAEREVTSESPGEVHGETSGVFSHEIDGGGGASPGSPGRGPGLKEHAS